MELRRVAVRLTPARSGRSRPARRGGRNARAFRRASVSRAIPRRRAPCIAATRRSTPGRRIARTSAHEGAARVMRRASTARRAACRRASRTPAGSRSRGLVWGSTDNSRGPSRTTTGPRAP